MFRARSGAIPDISIPPTSTIHGGRAQSTSNKQNVTQTVYLYAAQAQRVPDRV